MKFKSFKEMADCLEQEQKKYENCKHDFDDNPVCVMAVGRFGGDCIGIYRCKKCGFETSKKDEYAKAISKYDDKGMPVEQK